MGERSIIKWYRGDATLEFEKARLMSECGDANDFVAPRPQHLLLDENAVQFARLDLGPSLRDLYVEYLRGGESRRRLGWLREAGRILACLHRDLWCEKPVEWDPPPCMGAEARNRALATASADGGVFLHGDFGYGNLHLVEQEGEQRLAVLDASPNGYVTFATFQHGPRELDLGQLIACLHGQFPITFYPSCDWKRVGAAIDAFAAGYEQATGAEVDWDLVLDLARSIARCYYRWRFGARILSALATRVLFHPAKGITYDPGMRNPLR